MDEATARRRAPKAAGVLLAATGVLLLLVGVALAAAPVPAAFGVPLPTSYRLVLAGLGVVGGLVHVLAGWWAWQQRDRFRTVFAALLGLVLVQVSIPADLLALGLLYLGRNEFEE